MTVWVSVTNDVRAQRLGSSNSAAMIPEFLYDFENQRVITPEYDTDWKPVRIELYSDELGYLDIHPFVLSEDGTSKQADLEGGWYEFEKDYFGSAFFEGKTIPCISLKGQRVFHSGYELRDKDKHDISILESLSK